MSRLLDGEPAVVTAGVALFADALRAQAVAGHAGRLAPAAGRRAPSRTPWPACSPTRAGRDANATAVGRMLAAGARLVDVRPAAEALGLRAGHIPARRAADRLGPGVRAAARRAHRGDGLRGPGRRPGARPSGARRPATGVALEPVPPPRARSGPMAGVVSPSMWVFELDDPVHGGAAWCSLNEGLGKVLRYGAYGPEVIERLQLDVRRARAAAAGRGARPPGRRRRRRQGDRRPDAADGRRGPQPQPGRHPDAAARAAAGDDRARRCRRTARTSPGRWRFIAGNDHFFLNLGMPACKLATDAARDVPGSTVVVAMARNGTDFGIQVSGTGDRWFTGPANTPEGLFLGDYGPDDANPDIGDSAITETAGIGGFAMAAAPAIVRFVGGDVAVRARHDPPDVRDHPGREPAVRDPRARVPRDARPAST